MSQYRAEAGGQYEGLQFRPGWVVRNTALEPPNVVAFFPNKNNNKYLPDFHVWKAKLTAWYYNHFRKGGNP